jgi:hypothetical protein
MSTLSAIPNVPTQEALQDAMALAQNSTEAATYLASRFKEIVMHLKKPEQYKELVSQLDNFARIVRFKLNASNDTWSGKDAEKSAHKNMHENLANSAVKNLQEEKEKSFTLDYAMDEKAHFLRGFSGDNKPLNEASANSMDILFNAYLAHNNIISKSGILYKADDNGDVQFSVSGEPLHADVERVKGMLNEKSFDKFLAQKGLKLTSQEHPFPGSENETQHQQSVKQGKATEPRSAPAVPESDEAEVKPGKQSSNF